jgi:hypothetical protein
VTRLTIEKASFLKYNDINDISFLGTPDCLSGMPILWVRQWKWAFSFSFVFETLLYGWSKVGIQVYFSKNLTIFGSYGTAESCKKVLPVFVVTLSSSLKCAEHMYVCSLGNHVSSFRFFCTNFIHASRFSWLARSNLENKSKYNIWRPMWRSGGNTRLLRKRSRVRFPHSANNCVHEHVCLYWVWVFYCNM